MENKDLQKEANRISHLASTSLEDMKCEIYTMSFNIGKLPGCLDAIHDELIELETELEKSLKYQERSAKALEEIASALKSIASNYSTQCVIAQYSDE
jgi:hypothetical protein